MMTNINQDFLTAIGNRLRKLRKSKKLTQVQLSDILSDHYNISIDSRSISRYETGKSLPETDNLIYLSEFFETSTEYILYGKELSDDNSFTWYDNFKRLNRIMYTMQTKMLRHEENRSSVYINLLDNEAKEWFGRIERFVENKRLMLNHNKIDKITNIKDLDALFEDFKQDRTQLCPTEERIRRYFLSTPPLAITIAKEENGEIIITTKIPKQS